MANVRSPNRSRGRVRPLSRLLVPLLVAGVGVFVLYAFNPFGQGAERDVARRFDADATADVAPPPPAQPSPPQPPEPQRPAVVMTSTPVRGQAAVHPLTQVPTPVRPPATDTDGWDLSDASETPADDARLASHAESAPERTSELPADWDASALRHRDAGELLAARSLLNAALLSGTLDAAGEADVRSRLRELNGVIVFTPTRRFADDPHQGEHTVKSGELLGSIARPWGVPYGLLARVNAVQPNRIRVGQSLKTVRGPLHAVVSKSRFEMDVYMGGLPGEDGGASGGATYLTTYPVGLGEDGSTPTGLWEVTRGSKLENPAWTNPRTNQVFAADDPMNPLGDRWIGLTGIGGDALGQPSYGIHGTIEPETIGTNASMGCIRLLDDDIAAVFDMLSEGTSRVRVVE